MTTEPSKTTDYALASGAKDNPDVIEGVAVDSQYGYKADIKAHKCCGGCCDMRRAVIIVNIINSCFLALGLASFTYIAAADGGNIDDDEVEDAYTSLNAGIGALIAISAIKLVISLFTADSLLTRTSSSSARPELVSCPKRTIMRLSTRAAVSNQQDGCGFSRYS